MCNTKMKKVLILVLSADFHPYDEMIQTSLNTWDSVEVEGVETAFYCGKSKKKNTDKIIYLNVKDGMLQMGHKALEAFKWALNKEFDYIARVNSSTYVNKKTLLQYVQNLPDNNLFAGIEADSQNGFKYCWGGTGYIISKDVIQKIVDNSNLWHHGYMEDESLSLIVKELGYDFTMGYGGAIDKMETDWRIISYGGGESISFTDFADLKPLKHHFIRVKQDQRRLEDKFVMNELFRVL